MSRYYRTCLCCGANLDPGEICDCKTESRAANAQTEHDKKEE